MNVILYEHKIRKKAQDDIILIFNSLRSSINSKEETKTKFNRLKKHIDITFESLFATLNDLNTDLEHQFSKEGVSKSNTKEKIKKLKDSLEQNQLLINEHNNQIIHLLNSLVESNSTSNKKDTLLKTMQAELNAAEHLINQRNTNPYASSLKKVVGTLCSEVGNFMSLMQKLKRALSTQDQSIDKLQEEFEQSRKSLLEFARTAKQISIGSKDQCIAPFEETMRNEMKNNENLRAIEKLKERIREEREAKQRIENAYKELLKESSRPITQRVDNKKSGICNKDELINAFDRVKYENVAILCDCIGKLDEKIVQLDLLRELTLKLKLTRCKFINEKLEEIKNAAEIKFKRELEEKDIAAKKLRHPIINKLKDAKEEINKYSTNTIIKHINTLNEKFMTIASKVKDLITYKRSEISDLSNRIQSLSREVEEKDIEIQQHVDNDIELQNKNKELEDNYKNLEERYKQYNEILNRQKQIITAQQNDKVQAIRKRIEVFNAYINNKYLEKIDLVIKKLNKLPQTVLELKEVYRTRIECQEYTAELLQAMKTKEEEQKLHINKYIQQIANSFNGFNDLDLLILRIKRIDEKVSVLSNINKRLREKSNSYMSSIEEHKATITKHKLTLNNLLKLNESNHEKLLTKLEDAMKEEARVIGENVELTATVEQLSEQNNELQRQVDDANKKILESLDSGAIKEQKIIKENYDLKTRVNLLVLKLDNCKEYVKKYNKNIKELKDLLYSSNDDIKGKQQEVLSFIEQEKMKINKVKNGYKRKIDELKEKLILVEEDNKMINEELKGKVHDLEEQLLAVSKDEELTKKYNELENELNAKVGIIDKYAGDINRLETTIEQQDVENDKVTEVIKENEKKILELNSDNAELVKKVSELQEQIFNIEELKSSLSQNELEHRKEVERINEEYEMLIKSLNEEHKEVLSAITEVLNEEQVMGSTPIEQLNNLIKNYKQEFNEYAEEKTNIEQMLATLIKLFPEEETAEVNSISELVILIQLKLSKQLDKDVSKEIEELKKNVMYVVNVIE